MVSCVEVDAEKEMLTELVSEYSNGQFLTKIYSVNNGSMLYVIEPIFDFEENPVLFAELTKVVYDNKEKIGKEILKFDELLSTIKNLCLWELLKRDIVSKTNEIAELFALKLIKLTKLFSIFTDNAVNEIYMDYKGAPIYLDHEAYGRCNTEIILEEEELDAFITRLKLEHPIQINYNSPSCKIDFHTERFNLRVSIDFPPLSPNGPTFNIRRFKDQPYTIEDLIKLESFPRPIGNYLINAVKNRKNITIVGEPNSGKTTLANAIDLHTPKYWRKITIEDAIESIDQKEMGYKQLYIQVDSFESNQSAHTKTSEILKLLHRSPDWIFLGEIQSKEHSQAMFEALNAGLKGIQTTHSNSVNKIFRRWKNLHAIAPDNFLSLEVIIIMTKKVDERGIKRVIGKIYEVEKSKSKANAKLLQLTKIYDERWKEKKVLSALNETISKKSLENNDRK